MRGAPASAFTANAPRVRVDVWVRPVISESSRYDDRGPRTGRSVLDVLPLPPQRRAQYRRSMAKPEAIAAALVAKSKAKEDEELIKEAEKKGGKFDGKASIDAAIKKEEGGGGGGSEGSGGGGDEGGGGGASQRGGGARGRCRRLSVVSSAGTKWPSCEWSVVHEG